MNCPNGCNGCPNPICVCGEKPSPQNEANLKECTKERSIDLGQCIIDCKDHQSCEESCVNLFKAQYNECPCQVRRKEESIILYDLTNDNDLKMLLRMIVP